LRKAVLRWFAGFLFHGFFLGWGCTTRKSKGEKQIPFGDDNQKDNDKGKGGRNDKGKCNCNGYLRG
jgi:hypothetical protein